MSLKEWGFSTWFEERVDPAKLDGCRLARVIVVNKDNVIITDGERDTQAELTGKLMFDADSPLDYPAVGDWVAARYFNDDDLAVIQEILPRKSLLKRKTPGKKIDFQLIAANIDTALIMQSLDANFNRNRLERYLVMAHEANIHPVALLSKSDLLSVSELKKRKADILAAMPELKIVAFSNVDGSGLEKVKKLLKPGFTFCLLGSSGVGKTTLLNTLLSEELFETRAVREKDGKGRHATSRRQLIRLPNGAMIIDTPGMRELGLFDVESGLEETFDEIAALVRHCRYTDCTHTHETGCAVLAAVEEGKISRKRYDNFIKMMKESAYQRMSYLEKRRRDKAFGKMVKSVMKTKIKK